LATVTTHVIVVTLVDVCVTCVAGEARVTDTHRGSVLLLTLAVHTVNSVTIVGGTAGGDRPGVVTVSPDSALHEGEVTRTRHEHAVVVPAGDVLLTVVSVGDVDRAQSLTRVVHTLLTAGQCGQTRDTNKYTYRL